MDFDFHTHRLDATPGTAIVCLPRHTVMHGTDGQWQPQPGGMYAAGIHPWWTEAGDFDAETYIRGTEALLAHPEVVQVGECGIDRLRGADMECQQSIMESMVEISERRQRPMTIHCVRAYDILLMMHKRLRPKQKWTVHGFRGNAALARQLLEAGMDLSFGRHFNAEAWLATPPHRRHWESDAE